MTDTVVVTAAQVGVYAFNSVKFTDFLKAISDGLHIQMIERATDEMRILSIGIDRDFDFKRFDREEAFEVCSEYHMIDLCEALAVGGYLL